MAVQARVTQVVAEVLKAPDQPQARVTQAVAEVIAAFAAQARVTQVVAEVLVRRGGGARAWSQII